MTVHKNTDRIHKQPLHYYNWELAVRYGVVEAIVLYNIMFWVETNKAKGKNFHDGRTWTYSTLKAFHEVLPELTVGLIRGALKNLEKEGVLVTGSYNKRGGDRTKWYSVVYEKCVCTGQDGPSANAFVNPTNAGLNSANAFVNPTIPFVNPTQRYQMVIEDGKQTDKSRHCSLTGGETFSDFLEWNSEAGERVLSLMPGDLIPEISKIPDSKGVTRKAKAEAMMHTGLYPVLCAMVDWQIDDPQDLVKICGKIKRVTIKPGELLTIAAARLATPVQPRETMTDILEGYSPENWPYLEECRIALGKRMQARLNERNLVRRYSRTVDGKSVEAFRDLSGVFGPHSVSELFDESRLNAADRVLEGAAEALRESVHELWKRAEESGLKATTAREWFEAVAAMFPDGQVRPVISLIAAVSIKVPGLKACLAGNAAMRERILLDLARSQAHRDALSKRCGFEEAMLDMLSIHPGIFKELIDEAVDLVLEGV